MYFFCCGGCSFVRCQSVRNADFVVIVSAAVLARCRLFVAIFPLLSYNAVARLVSRMCACSPCVRAVGQEVGRKFEFPEPTVHTIRPR